VPVELRPRFISLQFDFYQERPRFIEQPLRHGEHWTAAADLPLLGSRPLCVHLPRDKEFVLDFFDHVRLRV